MLKATKVIFLRFRHHRFFRRFRRFYRRFRCRHFCRFFDVIVFLAFDVVDFSPLSTSSFFATFDVVILCSYWFLSSLSITSFFIVVFSSISTTSFFIVVFSSISTYSVLVVLDSVVFSSFFRRFRFHHFSSLSTSTEDDDVKATKMIKWKSAKKYDVGSDEKTTSKAAKMASKAIKK